MRATPLEEELRQRISEQGPLSFSEVMSAALYHPSYGYYTNLRGFGADGDFITSPERHPAFGWLLGRQALDVWEGLGQPVPFRILELGGGSGALAESLVDFLRAYVPRIVYTLDEVSPSLREVQQARLKGSEFRWQGADEEADFIVANEMVDALPVHRAVVRSGEYRELLVGIDEPGALSFQESSWSNREIGTYFEVLDYTPSEGSVVDVCLELPRWVHSVAKRVRKGVALVMDYAASPPRDSLLTYYRHTMGSDPLVRLGQQDISTHVDVQTLVRLANEEALTTYAVTQRALLFNLGFKQVYGTSTGQADREALHHLVDAGALGGQIKAVFLTRSMPEEYKPAGVIGRKWSEPVHVPRVEPDQQEAEFLNMWRGAFAVSEAQEETAEA